VSHKTKLQPEGNRVNALQEVIDELARQLEAMAGTLRRYGAVAGEDLQTGLPQAWADPVERARALHPALGERQEQVLHEVATAHPGSMTSGDIYRSIGYDQANTYLTLDALSRHGFVRKDATTRPHRYYLGARLLSPREREDARKS
jgi:hypothetical protein